MSYKDRDYINYISKKDIKLKEITRLLNSSSDQKISVNREIKLIVYDPFFGARLI